MVRGPATLAMLTALGCSSLPVVARDAGADARDGSACDGSTCDGRCVDLARDPAHCGACGSACAPGVDCIGGGCSRRIARLSAELNHTCALTVDGAVWCWGNNEYGECGDGSRESVRPAPVRAAVDDVAAVVAGWQRTCVIARAGGVRCWGDNGPRLIADEPSPTYPDARALDLSGRVSALDPSFALCALLDDGGVWCRPNFNAAPRLPYRRWTGGAVALGSGWGHVCALLDDGGVRCGGRRGYGTLGDGNTTLAGIDYYAGPVPPEGLPRVVQLASNAAGNCARTAEGAVWCWGQVYNDNDNDERILWTPTRFGDASPAQALWSRRHGYILRRPGDDALYGWGRNIAGGLGDGTETHRPTPVRLTALDAIAPAVVDIAGGLEHTCALLRDGTVRCWGSNLRGQLGIGTLGGRSLVPVAPRW